MGNQIYNPNEPTIELHNEEIAMLKDSSNLSEDQIRDIYEAFKAYSSSGKLQKSAFMDYFKRTPETNEKYDQFIERLFNVIDKNCDGSINFKEFLLFVAIMEQEDVDRMLEISFKLLDQSNDGYISYNEMVNYMKMLEELDGIDDEEETVCEDWASAIFNELGVDKEDKINEKQFIEGCKKKEICNYFGTETFFCGIFSSS